MIKGSTYGDQTFQELTIQSFLGIEGKTIISPSTGVPVANCDTFQKTKMKQCLSWGSKTTSGLYNLSPCFSFFAAFSCVCFKHSCYNRTRSTNVLAETWHGTQYRKFCQLFRYFFLLQIRGMRTQKGSRACAAFLSTYKRLQIVMETLFCKRKSFSDSFYTVSVSGKRC